MHTKIVKKKHLNLKKKREDWRKQVTKWLLFLLGILICMPVIMVILGSIKSRSELINSLAPIFKNDGGKISWNLFSLYPTFMNYVKLLFQTPQFFTVFWNSVKIAVGVLGGQAIVAIPAAWAFARCEFRFKKMLFTLYIVLMLIPFQVTMLPSYLVINKLNMMDSIGAVILPAIFSTFPVFLIYRSFASIPEGLIEAARIDGASEWKIFTRIGIPLGSSGILSALVLGFLDCWNLIEQPLAFLGEKSTWPLSLYLPEIGSDQIGLSFAADIITLIPAVFVFILGQDYMERGIIQTGMKE